MNTIPAPTAIEKPLYTAVATATAGREGRAKTDDGSFDLPLVLPKVLGGAGTGGTNPEQLFAAGYAACFGSAIAHVARVRKLKIGTVNVRGKVTLGPVGTRFGLAVELAADIPGVTREEGTELLAAAHEICPYSNATRGNIVVDIRLAD